MLTKKLDSSADTRLVNLALSTKTGMVSPQFHIQFDNFLFYRPLAEKLDTQIRVAGQIQVDQKPPSETPNIDRSNMTKAIIEQMNY